MELTCLSVPRDSFMTNWRSYKIAVKHSRDGRFGSKVGQIGPKMGEIQEFFRSDFSAFGAPAPNALKSDLKKSRICPIWGQSDPLWSQTSQP